LIREPARCDWEMEEVEEAALLPAAKTLRSSKLDRPVQYRFFRRSNFLALRANSTDREGSARASAASAQASTNVMVLLLARVIGIGIETADLLVQGVLSRNLRDQRAVARYSGLTGSPDESGKKRREKGLARSGNARVRRGMIQLAWRFLEFQKESALAKWFRARTENARGSRKKMIVALARKLLIALWRFVRDGVVPEGIVLRPAQ
jgi:transposase